MSSSSGNLEVLTDEEVEEAFRKFRPFCTALIKSPKREILEKLDRLIGMSHPDDLVRLEEYIMFPMQIYLQTPVMPENYTILVLNVIERFFKRAKLHSFFVLKDILSNILPIMGGLKKKLDDKAVQVSEDLKEASCNCLTRMLKSSVPDVVEKLYDDEMKLPLSHLVMLALEFTEKYVALTKLALSSLNLISALCPVKEESESVPRITEKFRTLFKQMLPGITTNLMKVLKNNSANISWKVKVAALESWSDYVIGILNDAAIEEEQDEVWLNKARDHIQMHMQILQGLAAASTEETRSKSAQMRFRGQLLKMVQRMTQMCKNSLENLR